MVGYYIDLRHGNSVCWYLNRGLSLDQLQQIRHPAKHMTPHPVTGPALVNANQGSNGC